MTPRGTLFPWYGSKWRVAPSYPAPARHMPIVEPFAGSAGYARRYAELGQPVYLFDVNPLVCAAWRFLIRASDRDIQALPCPPAGTRTEDLDVSGDALAYLSMWFPGTPMGFPAHVVSPWGAARWHQRAKDQVCARLPLIRSWMVQEVDYTAAPDIVGTWFVDPPYRAGGGRKYAASSRELDYASLGAWCSERRGFVIVCEGAGHGSWLPFERHRTASLNVRGRYSQEYTFFDINEVSDE